MAIVILVVVGCSSEETTQTQELDQPLTYLALGDSYTIGESVDSTERYPVVLVEELRANGISIDAPNVIATTGWTTGELQDSIDRSNLKDTFHLVSLLIGVNNQFRGPTRGYTLADYKLEFDSLLEQAIAFAGGIPSNVFVVSIPDYAYTPYGQANDPERISKGIDDYNNANQAITTAKGVEYYYITDLSRQGIEQPELVAADNLHPSGAQYRLWVERFLPSVLAKVQ